MDFVRGSERLTSVFGRWPSFHDSEVHWIKAERDPGGSPTDVTISLGIHLFDWGPEVDEKGNFKTFSHTLAVLRFRDCHEVKISLDPFNHQNVLGGLTITPSKDGWIDLLLDSIYGVGGTLKCKSVEVVSAEPFLAAR